MTDKTPLRLVLLHGYALHGSGSNVYVNNLSRSLAALGHEVHVVCQEPGSSLPEHVASLTTYDPQGNVVETLSTEHPGATVALHRPALGAVLPVYNWDRYPGFDSVVTFPELSDDALERYVLSHALALRHVVREHAIQTIHANHVVAMPEVARRVSEELGVPFVVMPHGSAIEYVVRKDARYHQMAELGLTRCAGIVVGGDEMLERMDGLFPLGAEYRQKSYRVPTGVDLELFRPRQTSRSSGPQLKSASPSKGNHLALRDRLVAEAEAARSDTELLDVVRKHRTRYEPRQADVDLAQKLGRVGYGDARVAFFGGKLVAGKGVHSLIAAMSLVCAADDRARLVLVGEGSFREALELLLVALCEGNLELFRRVVRVGWQFDDKPAEPLHQLAAYVATDRFESLSHAARRGRLAERVTFAGYLPHTDLAQLLAHSSVSVLPSAVPEAYPLSLVESLAAGVFPIVTDHGGARFFASDLAREAALSRDDIAVTPDADQVVEALAAVLTRRLASAEAPDSEARRIAEQTYGWPAIAASLADWYESIISQAA